MAAIPALVKQGQGSKSKLSGQSSNKSSNKSSADTSFGGFGDTFINSTPQGQSQNLNMNWLIAGVGFILILVAKKNKWI
jgi:hypothetical protein